MKSGPVCLSLNSRFVCLFSGIIQLRKSPPPRLMGPQYVLNITATDDNLSGGPYPLSSSTQVIVGINDINNNKPVFQEVSQSPLLKKHFDLLPVDSEFQSFRPSCCHFCLIKLTNRITYNTFFQCQSSSLNAAVLENQPPGTFVLRVQAEDADMGVNGEVKYGIMARDGVSSSFDIDPDSGNVHSDCYHSDL